VLLVEGEGLAVPPGQFGFLVTEEVVRVPADALGFISIRARVKARGLVNVSGFHVDPGYQGRLVFAVFNAGPAPVHLARGDDCFLIWFADLDRASRSAKAGTGFSGIPSDLINPIAGEIQSFAGLLAKIDATKKELEGRLRKVERDHTIVRWGVTLLVAAALSWLFRDHLPSTTGLRGSAPAPAATTQASDSPAP
jgi:dCTP deaminase